MPIRTKKYEAEISPSDRPGEACPVSGVKGWEKVRVQVDSGAIDTVGPKEVAKAFATKENVMSKKGLGYVAANWSRIKNYRQKKRSTGTWKAEMGLV